MQQRIQFKFCYRIVSLICALSQDYRRTEIDSNDYNRFKPHR